MTCRSDRLVVGGGNLRQQDDVGDGLGEFVADQGARAFGKDGMVEVEGFLKIGVYAAERRSYTAGTSTSPGPGRARNQATFGMPG